MKALRMVMVGIVALACATAYADDSTMQAQVAQQDAAATSVGGTNSTRSEMGSPQGKSRDQVYQELVQAQHNGQIARLQELYKGGN
ncbi:DUF4148 domain-containing protein [Paraburkholderia saeva]|uniref:DUF4148 domain-containing protein n=1 Tax=Paraburkholderia saeva TaxID=2777537 RepID=A0A9N8RZY3_9BURK|nr:DUF4148 domain-containing protein [Paraburkholderia saeva]CAG4904405.1 hypothetical protein R70241_03203 [Paraburkholderia saeva]CAG4906262.1 hypothetical protein R52603_03407 [Paraburkholderia saeva]CAG4910224.1 hypothetical protein LMG31841_03949 [Paraburkholderia saeva]